MHVGYGHVLRFKELPFGARLHALKIFGANLAIELGSYEFLISKWFGLQCRWRQGRCQLANFPLLARCVRHTPNEPP
jgi:hypothetical protein